MICQFCGQDPDLIIDPAVTYSPKLLTDIQESGLKIPEPHEQGHDCFCHREEIEWDGEVKRMRTAWGICCAKYEIGASLMAEEDYHDHLPWSEESDCTCR